METHNCDTPNNEDQLALYYHDNTSLTPATIMNFIENMSPSETIGHPRHYISYPAIVLNPGTLWQWKLRWSASLVSALSRRTSAQNFSSKISFKKLSQLLLISLQAGAIRDSGLRQRPYPSAGGLYGVNVFLLSTGVKDLAQGIYNVNSDRQCLEQILLFDDTVDCQQWINSVIVGEPATKKAPAYLFFCGNLGQVKEKYGERAYRFLLLEAGHIAQNIGLSAIALGMSQLPLGGFCEKLIEAKIGDPELITLYAMALG